MTIRFDGRVAIVTGAGNGLGRSHALALAARGARVVVNDRGGARDGVGSSLSAAEAVVEEIRRRGGEALASGASVADVAEVQEMVDGALRMWGRVDILVNNAGILRDKTFQNMTLEDFRLVLDVHLMGSVICSKAVWGPMREQRYGRIVMTSSASGIYGNFGQANYGAAKMGCVGLMNVLHLEGMKYDIRVNALAPTAATRMTEGIGLPEAAAKLMTAEAVTAGLLVLVSDVAPSRTILCAGAGGYARTLIYETDGIYLPPEMQTPENVADRLAELSDATGQQVFEQAGRQTAKFVRKAAQALGIALDEPAKKPT
jgi:NAD(P)-dependent dehydrogenase (short-subunit alcohol dehydrogenase family)